ncbi:MAG: hypothetical protein JJU33_02230 [Phycisphaerales bacterium]|nr:hypothetical protein [Phycisphaerales bacterium]
MKSICRRGMSTAAAVAGVVGVLALGVAGYTMLSGECGLSACTVKEDATVQTVAASKSCSSCESKGGCGSEAEVVLASAEKSDCSQTCGGEVASGCDGICDDLNKNQSKVLAASAPAKSDCAQTCAGEVASGCDGVCDSLDKNQGKVLAASASEAKGCCPLMGAEVVTASATSDCGSKCEGAKSCSDEKKSECKKADCPMAVASND